MTGYIHSTESFGTVDGPGIRFVVFFSGCPMRCIYCHNPDTWEIRSGTQMTVEEILDQYEGVKEFMKNGGITATGGEPLMQLPFLIELFTACKERGIHTCLDTSGVAFLPTNMERMKQFDALMEVTDLVMLDIKHINNMDHWAITGQPNNNILAFLDYLSQKNKDTWIRHVVVPNLTLKESDLYALGKGIGKYKNIKALDVLPYHTMGEAKYEKMGMRYALKGVPAATKEEAKWAREIILKGMRETRLQEG